MFSVFLLLPCLGSLLFAISSEVALRSFLILRLHKLLLISELIVFVKGTAVVELHGGVFFLAIFVLQCGQISSIFVDPSCRCEGILHACVTDFLAEVATRL